MFCYVKHESDLSGDKSHLTFIRFIHSFIVFFFQMVTQVFLWPLKFLYDLTAKYRWKWIAHWRQTQQNDY